jgi:CDP-diacylglycerol pyrophosphatase
MSSKLPRILAAAAASLAAIAAAVAGSLHTPGQKSEDLPPDPGRDALRQIVQQQCVVDWSQDHDPAPCERVYLADSKTNSSGYAVLADRKGGAHYLLIPVQTMRGIDSSELLDPDVPNYFAEAWHARDLISKFVGHEVPRTAIGLAVNKAAARSQDQFHIHIECLRQDVSNSLRALSARLTDAWTPTTVSGSPYDALRITGAGLDGANPFELLVNFKSEARHHMGDYTLVVAGAQFADGPGFIVLAGTGQTGELLLDSSCSAVGGGGG